ncbi:MAG TPA: hypothetical protein VJ989_05175 [Solirubrobacterales bacterium]|nr:hypothetical protein [Solirubrobacterales bacterium]
MLAHIAGIPVEETALSLAPMDVIACGPDGAPVKALAFDGLRLLAYR